MINSQWLELPMSRIHFHGPKDVSAIEVRLCIGVITLFGQPVLPSELVEELYLYSTFFNFKEMISTTSMANTY